MQHTGPGPGQRPHLPVADVGNELRVRHQGRVRSHHTRHIAPVFIKVRFHARGSQRAGDVRAVPGQYVNVAGGIGAIEPRHHDGLIRLHQPPQVVSRALFVQRPVGIEGDQVGGVHHGQAGIS